MTSSARAIGKGMKSGFAVKFRLLVALQPDRRALGPASMEVRTVG
jgi:hypothetical protein